MRRPGRMLWSLPEAAHRASVLRLIETLAAAKISTASASVIQSEAALGTSVAGPRRCAAPPRWTVPGSPPFPALASRSRRRRRSGRSFGASAVAAPFDGPFAGLRAGLAAFGTVPGSGPFPRSRRRARVLLRPARALEHDGRCRKRPPERAAAGVARRRARRMDAVDDLHAMPACHTDVLVDGHRAATREACACRTSDSRTRARGPTRSRSGCTRGLPHRRPARDVRRG